MDAITIDKNTCTGCGSCVNDCISSALYLEDNCACYKEPCILCGHCVAICPQNAITNTRYSEAPCEYHANTFDIPSENMINTIKFRRSIRDFQPERIKPEHLRAMIIDGAGHAPTAKNNQQVRFFVVEDELEEFKNIVWNHLRSAAEQTQDCALDTTTLSKLITLKESTPSTDYLFRNAPCAIFMDGINKLDIGLAASAFELVGTTLGVGVLYNGYLRRVVNCCPEAKAFLNADPDLHLDACLLVGYPAIQYQRTAPRRRPSIYLR